MIAEIFLVTVTKYLIAAMLFLVGFAAVAVMVYALRIVRAGLRWCWRATHG